ncbi:LuxR C-terminal-related transcriptional regulator [Paenibacillus kobensis]|uniref:LuxR C-terminal-related transcriptional regulator n=1 Tax=Paenibacillus kobensis TaxID=59841 RepID=UPI001C3FA8E5|nr:LuxR C-terminal-related transcriptional regulator [Paenibacillus kobensis]
MMLPIELMSLFEGAWPACLVTSSVEGIPNIANLTRVWCTETRHVAIANQLLNKSFRNLEENPLALLKIVNPQDLIHWEISVRYIRSDYEGTLFEQIRQDIETVSWVAGVPLPAQLRSAVVFEVVSVRQCVEESVHLKPPPETYGDLLNVLAAVHDWNRLSYWIPGETDEDVKLQASRGVPGAGVDESAFDSMKRLARLVKSESRIVRLKNIRSQLRYLHSICSESVEQGDRPAATFTEGTPVSYLAFPILSSHALAGIVCCEGASGQMESVHSVEDRYLASLAAKLGEVLLTISSIPAPEREALFKQVIELAKLQWQKEADPFHSSLSARERQVAVNVAKGLTNAEIAKQLFISPRTVTTHLERIYLKLNVPSRAALTRYVMEKGLLAEGSE